MRTQDTFLHTSNCVAHVKTAAIFIPAGMEITAVLYFLRNGVKLHFYSLGTIFEENMRESRGIQSLGSGFPIGARSIPVDTLGIAERVGKKRTDIPWVEYQIDPELVELVKSYGRDNRPSIFELLEKYPSKQVLIFKTRSEADRRLSHIEMNLDIDELDLTVF